MERVSPEQHRPNILELYPTPEDWEALQGGKPRVFANPHNPNTPWEVLHVYDEHGDPEKRFRSGIIVPTPRPEQLQVLGRAVPRRDEDGREYMKDIKVPSFMDRSVDRSAQVNGHGYDRITNQRSYEKYIEKLEKLGWVELRFGVSNDKFTFRPQKIRKPRPLDSPAE